MLAPRHFSDEYHRWNHEQGAPSGRSNIRAAKFLPRSLYEKRRGPYALQPNNSSREFEYPWAFYATPLEAGQQVLEIGGGLSGFQFTLDRHGCRVVNVDPGMEAKGVGWPCDQNSMKKLNRLFGTSVQLRNTVVTEAGLETDFYDRVFSISVLEHLPDDEIEQVLQYTFNCMKPGGFLILTIDLSLDIAPFTSRPSNRFGKNINIEWLVRVAPFLLVQGELSELNGFPEFDSDRIQSNLYSYLIARGYPTLTQCLVLQKPTN